MSGSLRIAIAAVLLAVAGLAGGAQRDPAAAEIGRLLAAQASAIERYDFDAYLATFTGERRQEESRVFRRLRQLPLAEVRMQLAPRPIDRSAAPVDGESRRRVELSYRFVGHADNPFVHQLDATFGRRAGGWRVAAIENAGPRPPAWRGGELVVHRTHHFLIATHPRLRPDLMALAADAEAAYAALQRRRLPLAPGYVVHFVADGGEFGRLTGRSQPGTLGAAVARFVVAGGRTTVDSRALYVNGPLFTEAAAVRYAPEARRATVTHELVHLALASWTRPVTPPWLKEGLAVYFSDDLTYDANRELVRRGLGHLSLERMTRAAALGAHASASQAADEYLFAGNVAAFLAAERGVESLLALYRSYAERPAAGIGADAASALAVELTEEALSRRYGLSIAGLEAAVREWLSIRHR